MQRPARRPSISLGVLAALLAARSALVEADHGFDVARTVARWMVLFVQRPGGQSQFSERLPTPHRPTRRCEQCSTRSLRTPAATIACIAWPSGLR
jgi:hypothetical protein